MRDAAGRADDAAPETAAGRPGDAAPESAGGNVPAPASWWAGPPAAVAATAVVSATVGVALKTWCGTPGAASDLYLRWCYSDIPPLFVVERLAVGAVPYLDHPVEYPVLTGAAMWLAAAVTDGLGGFVAATSLLLVAAAGCTGWLLGRAVGWRGLAFAAAPTLAVSAAVNWDLLAVALATAGLVLHRRGRDAWSGAALGLGAAAKLYPALLLPGVLLGAWGRGGTPGRRAAVVTAAAAAGAWTVVNLPVAIAAPDGWHEFYRRSRNRPADWDSLWAAADRLGAGLLTTTTVNAAVAVLLVAGGTLILVAGWRRLPPDRRHQLALPLVAWFLVTGKVWSPQFSIWLLPLFALAWPGWAWWGAFAAADVAVTLTRFPYLAGFVDGGLAGAWPPGPFTAAVLVRTVVVVGAVAAWWRTTRTLSSGTA